MTDMTALKAANAKRWTAAKLTRGSEFIPVAKRLVAAKERYQTVALKTGIPWTFIAVTHQRESSQDWTRSLAQGDRWDRESIHVPAGRGPFRSWEDAAVDALVNCAPHASKNTDWSIGGLLTLLERYNGLAYANAERPSPYIWSGTDQYRIGKVTRDHGPIEPVVDKQLGCAGLILAMTDLDPTITFGPSPKVFDAEWLQASLNKLGALPPLEVDGIAGAATRIAIRAFQKSHNLTVDGLAGPLTIAAITQALQETKT